MWRKQHDDKILIKFFSNSWMKDRRTYPYRECITRRTFKVTPYGSIERSKVGAHVLGPGWSLTPVQRWRGGSSSFVFCLFSVTMDPYEPLEKFGGRVAVAVCYDPRKLVGISALVDNSKFIAEYSSYFTFGFYNVLVWGLRTSVRV